MSKLRLDYFLSLGLKLDAGDVYEKNYGRITEVVAGNVAISNYRMGCDSERFITSFAPRKNEGVQPCCDDVPVVVDYNCSEHCEPKHGSAIVFNFGLDGDITSWTPDLDALIKMQIEHDAKQVKQTKPRTDESAAVATLKSMGYTWNGGSQWKPPLGKAPEYIKPRTKVEYVKVTLNKLSEAFAEHEKAPLYICDRGEYHKANGRWIYNIVEAGEWFSLYRKVETEITWQQDQLDLNVNFIMTWTSLKYKEALLLATKQQDCNMLASITDKPE